MTPPKFVRTTISERETLGEKLAKKRNSLHLDIRDVEKALKIPAKHIKYIEEGNYDKLPPDVYTNGFIKNYALFLGLNQKNILYLYKKERGLKGQIKAAKSKPPKVKPLKAPTIVITPKRLIIGFFSATVLGILIFIGWQVKILTAPPSLSIKSPGDNQNVTEDFVYVEGQTDREADLYINDVKVGTDDQGSFKERVSLQDGLNVLEIKAKNKMQRETNVERKIVAKLPVSSAAPIDRTLYPVELRVNIGPNPSTVTIVRDGEKLNVSGVMLPGSTQVFYAKNDFIVSTNNAGSTKIILNSKDLGPMGKEGQAVKDKKFSK